MTAYTDLIEAVRAVGPGPCEGCKNNALCGAEKIACRDYYTWLDEGSVQHEDRTPSRLWWLRSEEDGENEKTGGRYQAYWRGVRDACNSRGSPLVRQALEETALIELEDLERMDWYRDGQADADRHNVKALHRWKADNRRPTKATRASRSASLGTENVTGRAPQPKTPAERVAVQISHAREPQAVFYEGEQRWSVLAARLQSVQRRIEQDVRAFVGVFSPNCAPEWLLDSLNESARW